MHSLTRKTYKTSHLGMTTNRPTDWPGGYFVLDRSATSLRDAYCAGPFSTPEQAGETADRIFAESFAHDHDATDEPLLIGEHEEGSSTFLLSDVMSARFGPESRC